jgi:hypothetical protein
MHGKGKGRARIREPRRQRPGPRRRGRELVSATGREVRRVAAAAWRFRWQVERDAEARFARIAGRMARLGAPEPLVALARRASADERRHAALCARLAKGYGAAVSRRPPPADPPEIAPRRLGAREALLYEVVAACCVAETESVSVLTMLLAAPAHPAVRSVLRTLARDEIAHARLGWAWLAHERGRGGISFLAPLVPAMLEGNGADLFVPAAGAAADPALLAHGVLPRLAHRDLFVRTLEEVVFPGLESFDVDAAPARAWLAVRRDGRGRAAARAALAAAP